MPESSHFSWGSELPFSTSDSHLQPRAGAPIQVVIQLEIPTCSNNFNSLFSSRNYRKNYFMKTKRIWPKSNYQLRCISYEEQLTRWITCCLIFFFDVFRYTKEHLKKVHFYNIIIVLLFKIEIICYEAPNPVQ